MSFLPKPPKPGDRQPIDLPPEAEAAKDRMMEWVKMGHNIMKNVVQRDEEGAERAAIDLENKIKNTNFNDKDEVSAMASLILTLATQIPPTVYGEDYNEW